MAMYSLDQATYSLLDITKAAFWHAVVTQKPLWVCLGIERTLNDQTCAA